MPQANTSHNRVTLRAEILSAIEQSPQQYKFTKLPDGNQKIEPLPSTGLSQDDFKTIAFLSDRIAQIPSKSCLDTAKSDGKQDLINTWNLQRSASSQIALVFAKIGFRLKIDKIPGRGVEKLNRNLCEKFGYYFYSLWKLIQVSFEKLSQQISDLPSTAVDVFLDIVADFIERSFILRTTAYYKIDTSKPESLESTPALLQKIIPVLLELSEQDKQIASYLKSCEKEHIELYEFHKELIPKRNAQGKLHKSEIWQDGIRKVDNGRRFI
ncbi:hypothetical protein ACN4EK_25960 [Pantanalinema rosaneae CENA516]|uniref:hypothetical protein n=1 Tax=Pantanalinema rosaneae TaxID=1620701 RepID=UPI003D6F6A09